MAAEGIAALDAFAGDVIVKHQGELAPALVSDGWRSGIVEWSRGKAFGDIGLPPANTGEDLVVLVADVMNWQATSTELSLDTFSLESASGVQRFPVDLELANLAAAYLGEVPLEPGLPIVLQPGELRRVIFVFPVDSSTGELALRQGDARIALEQDPGLEVFGALRPPAVAPPIQAGTVANVIDGRTLLVTLADTGENERVRLIGVDAPQDSAVEQLTAYVGQSVQLEGDPNHPDDNRLQRYVWVTDAAGIPSMRNETLIEAGLASFDTGGANGRFDAMLATGSAVSTSTTGVEETAPPSTDPAGVPTTSELTEADLAYLAELARHRDNIRVSLLFYDNFLSNPTLDEAYFAQLGIAVLGWTTFYNGIVQLEPTPRFAELHARLIAAYQPFSDLAYQIEPELDAILAGQVPQAPFSGFDFDVMAETVANARPALEQVLTEIDAELEAAGIQTESLPTS
jgi:hypothetical protein